MRGWVPGTILLLPALLWAQAPSSLTLSGRERPLVLRQDPAGMRVRLGELQEALGGEVSWVEPGRRARWELEGGTILFTCDAPFFLFNRRTYQMASAPVLEGGELLLPVQFVQEFLPYLYPRLFHYNGATRSLQDAREMPLVAAVRKSAEPTRTTCLLLCTGRARFAVDSARPGSLLLQLFGARLAEGIGDSLRSVGYIDSVTIYPSGAGPQILFHLRPETERYRVAEMQRPLGIQLAFSGRPVVPGAAPPRREDQSSGRTRPEDFLIRTIVLDPGHGGKDPGAIARGGLKEKDVNLAIALKLERLLRERLGLKTVLTRREDRFIPLRSRTALANSMEADLFLSIHCNSSRNAAVSGFEAYYLSDAKTDEERAVALRENMSLKYEEPGWDPSSQDDLEVIFWDLAQNEYLRESSEWADLLVREVDGAGGLAARGVKQAGFYVLNGAYMPAVLVETAYLSNRADARWLADPAFQERVARQLYEGIRRYVDQYHRKIRG